MRSLPFVLTAAVLAACAGEPPPPVEGAIELDLPRAWTTAADTESGAIRIDWWREFDDQRLDELVALGLANNPNLQASAARLEAATAAHTIAGAPLLPALDASFNADRTRRLFLGFPFGGGGGVPSTTISQYGLSVGVRWELDVWGRLRSADAAALADQQAALDDLHGAQLSLAAQICRAFYAAVEAQQQMALAEATATAFERTLADVRDRFRRGVRPALEVHQAATNLANAEANTAQRRELLQRARQRRGPRLDDGFLRRPQPRPPRRVAARQQPVARRHAPGTRRVRVGEAHAFGCEPVEVGRRDLRASPTERRVAVAHVVGEHEHDVRRAREARVTLGDDGRGRAGEQAGDASEHAHRLAGRRAGHTAWTTSGTFASLARAQAAAIMA